MFPKDKYRNEITTADFDTNIPKDETSFLIFKI